MTITLNGTTGISNDGGYTGDGILFADTTPSNTLVTTTGGNVGIGTSSPGYKLDVNATSFIAANVSTSYSGAGNIRIADASTTSASAPYIGSVGNNLTFGRLGTAEYARIDSSGNLLVGVTSGSGKIRMKQSADAHSGAFTLENFGNTNTWSFLVGSDNNLYFGYNATSRGVFNNSTGAYTTISDQRLKKDISEIQYGLNSVLALRPVSYLMKDQTEGANKTLGFIAQEVNQIVPESVLQMQDDFYGMDKEALIPVLVKAIQELKAIVDAQGAEIAALKGTQ
jgi:hypothetical protein